MKPALWRAPDDALMGLRDVGRQINRLTAARTQAKNRLHALRSKSATLPLLIEDEMDGIERLNQRIERLSKAAVELLFKVQVEDVQVLNRKGKAKRFGRFVGRRRNERKAYVSLKDGQEINLAEVN